MEKKQLQGWNKNLFENTKGQALLELAVFGSFLIMLIGVLVSYGMRFDAQQRAEQFAFRKALNQAFRISPTIPISGIGADADILDFIGFKGDGSYVMIKDIHVPDPANPWGVGQVTPVSASATVVRNEQLHKTPDLPYEVSDMVINVNGAERTYKTAGMRVSVSANTNVEGEIYGTSNVWNPLTDLLSEILPSQLTDLISPGIAVIVDNSDGEIVNYDAAVRQCRMVVDPIVYVQECLRSHLGGGLVENPLSIAACVWLPTVTPWYCQGAVLTDAINRQWYFPVLEEEEFAGTGVSQDGARAMGIQPDYVKNVLTSNMLTKEENHDMISTTENVNWSDTTDRRIMHVQHICSGCGGMGPTITTVVTDTLGQNTGQTMRTSQ